MQIVRELVKPANQLQLDPDKLAEEMPRVLTMGGAVTPPAAVRFSIREHIWQRELPISQVRSLAANCPSRPFAPLKSLLQCLHWLKCFKLHEHDQHKSAAGGEECLTASMHGIPLQH